MPSEKLIRILRSKTLLSEVDIQNISEHDGWALVYRDSQGNKKKSAIQICFTGFNVATKQTLTQRAESVNFRVVTAVTKELNFLCVGANPGEAKLQKAAEQRVKILNEQQFLSLAETGELPEPASDNS